MKIIMVNKFLYPKGGAETYMLKVGECLESRGHEVAYFGMYDEKNTVGNSLGLSTTNMDFHGGGPGRFLYPFRIIYSFEAKKKLIRLIQTFQPDIVHLNNINYQLTPSVIDACAECHVPIVQTVHDAQMLCPSHMMLDLKTKETCQKCIYGSKWNCFRHKCIHGSSAKSLIGTIEALFYKLHRSYDKVNLYISPSRFMESVILNEKSFSGKTMVLQNFMALKDAGENITKKDYILYFGRLSEEKGVDRLIEACAMLPDQHFIIAGNGPDEEKLRKAAPSNVEFVGFKTGEELNTLIREAAFSVYLPIWYENCPLSVLESQCMGTPVMANRIGGIPELIREGETGVLLDEPKPEFYAKAIAELMGNREKLEKMTGNCRNITDLMTLDVYCDRLLDIYRNIVTDTKNEKNH